MEEQHGAWHTEMIKWAKAKSMALHREAAMGIRKHDLLRAWEVILLALNPTPPLKEFRMGMNWIRTMREMREIRVGGPGRELV